MIVLAVDPGTRESAVLAYDGKALRPGIQPPVTSDNESLLRSLRFRAGDLSNNHAAVLVIESVEHYGQRVGEEVFTTVRWSGRFQEAWERGGGVVELMPRRKVKAHLCGVQKAKDADIRQALLHRFGDGTRGGACGTKAKPGPLYGIGSHPWSALAIAVTYADLSAAPSR